MDRTKKRPEEQGAERAAKRLSAPPAAAAAAAPGAPRPLRPLNQWAAPLQPAPLLQPLPLGAAYSLWHPLGAAGPQRATLAPPPRRPLAPPPSPGWPACSPEKTRQPSEDAVSPRAEQVHVLAADVREASTSGHASRNVERSLLLAAGAGCASINPSLATRNRKTGGWVLELCWHLSGGNTAEGALRQWCRQAPTCRHSTPRHSCPASSCLFAFLPWSFLQHPHVSLPTLLPALRRAGPGGAAARGTLPRASF